MTTLFLTGATGMVGREVLARALADTRNDAVLCLVRPGRDQSAQQRLDELLGKMGIAPSPRAQALAGDVAEPALGLAPADRERASETTHVIHCAATVRFDHPVEEARKINVQGTREVLALGRALPKLARIDAVSTAYVAGRRDDRVREEDLGHGRGFHNTYEQTKHESEGLLREAMRELPIAVHRPSIVVGDSRTGRTGAYKVLYWPLKVMAKGWLPVIPYDPAGVLDVVPVDFVADAVLALSRDPSALGKTFHLTAGPARDTTMDVLARAMFARFQRRPPLRISPVWFRRVVRPVMMAAPIPRLRRTLETGLVYRPYLELRLRFDTTEADRHLAPLGVHCPRVLDYFDTIVDEALRTDFGRRA
jgi:long-chain acyl-CoA synthetase